MKTGKKSPSYSRVKKLAAELRRERESTEDDEQSSYPKKATTDENVEIVHTPVMCDRRRNLLDIASEVGINFGAVQSIIIDRNVSCLIMRMTLRNLWTEL